MNIKIRVGNEIYYLHKKQSLVIFQFRVKFSAFFVTLLTGQAEACARLSG